MTLTNQSSTYQSAVAGAVLQVASASKIKPILSGLLYLIGAGLLLPCGGIVAYISLTENKLPMLCVAAPFILLGLIWTATAVRRFRAAGDKRIYLHAGPDGLIVGVPVTNKIKNAVRLSYRFVYHDMAWHEIRTWYPHVIRVNGFPTSSSLVFEGVQGWRLSVPLLYLAGSQKQIVDDLNLAIARTDLREQ
jgi:hypothetical protein